MTADEARSKWHNAVAHRNQARLCLEWSEEHGTLDECLMRADVLRLWEAEVVGCFRRYVALVDA